MRASIRNMAIIMLLLTLVGGGFVCMVYAENTMDHVTNTVSGTIDTHLAYVNALNQGLTAPVSIVLASLLVLVFILLHLFNTPDIGLSGSSVSPSRHKWREPLGILYRRLSWLSLLVRSPGAINTA